MSEELSRNDSRGSPGNVVQAGNLHGDVHIHHDPQRVVAESPDDFAGYKVSPLSRVAVTVSGMGMVDWLAGGSRRRVERTARRLETTFAAETLVGEAAADAARRYRKALRLALRLQPAQARWWLKSYDHRIPYDCYKLAFRHDRGWLTYVLRVDDPYVAGVVFELATRMRLRPLQGMARDRTVDLLHRQSDANVIVEHCRRWLEEELLDTATLTRSLQPYLARYRLERDSDLWTSFFRELPQSLLPDLFDVYCFLGRGADAVRLADTVARQHRAVECCVRSAKLGDVEAGLELARDALGDEAVSTLAERAGDLLSIAERYADAVVFYREGGRDDRAGECYEQLGQFYDAMTCCPSDQPDRLARLVALCQPDIDALVARREFTEAALLVEELVDHLDQASERTLAVLRCRHDIQVVRADLLAGGRQYLGRMIEQTAAAEQQAIYGTWSQFEEACGEMGAAAQRAEDGDDFYRASRLFRRAGRFGDADRVLKGEQTPEAMTARAQAREAGGDLVGAARFYEDSGQIDQAVDLFVRAGQFGAAARSLVLALGEDAVEDTRLIQCLRRSGGYDELVTLCLQAIDRTGLRSAAVGELRSLKEENVVPPRLAPEVERVLAQIDELARRPFESRAQAWVARARQEMDQRFARIWGLDLGTTTCVAAIYDTQSQRPVLCPWRSSAQFAATLSVDRQDNEVVGLAGEEVLASWVTGHISSSKRKMGTRTLYRIRDRRYHPEEVAARFIRHARGMVENFLTAQVRERVSELACAELGDVNDEWMAWAERHHNMRLERPRVLVTIPAYFTNNQKYATRAACEIAEVEVVRLIHEPTAACMAAARERALTGRVAVVDLGAGTLDVSLLDVEDKVHEVLRVLGNNQYGGNDFDAAVRHSLREHLARDGIQVPATGSADRRLGVAAEELKVALSSQGHAEYRLPGFLGHESVRVSLSRAELAEVLAGPLGTLRDTCAKFKASLDASAQHLVLVGRPMLSPLVQELIEDVFGIKRTMLSDPRTAVACGAALQAAVLDNKLKEVLLLDVTPLALGIRAMDKDDNPHFSTLMEANTKIPATHENDYTTARDNQTSVAIEIFNGQLETGSKIGQFDLTDIPPAPHGKPRITVTFSIDASCVLEVNARDNDTGKTNSIRITDTTLLSPGEITAMAQRYQAERIRLQEREALERVCRELHGLIVESVACDAGAAWQEFIDRKAAHHTSSAPLDDQTGQTLFEIYSGDNQLHLELDLAIRPLPGVAAQAQKYLDRTREGDLSAQLEEAERLKAELNMHLNEVQPLLAALTRWNAVLQTVAITDPDPVRRFRSQHDAGNYHDALEALGEMDGALNDLDDVERHLHCLAEIGDIDAYRSVLLANAGQLHAFPFMPTTLAGPLESVLPVLARIDMTLPDGRHHAKNGFVVGNGLVATNQHWLAESYAADVKIGIGEETYVVEDIYSSPDHDHDVVLLKLAGSGPELAARRGYPKSVRIGDRVWAFTAAAEHGATQLLIPGLVDKFEGLIGENPQVFKVGLELPPHCSGGPLFNDLGEVVGILTINEDDSGTTTDGSVAALTSDVLRPLIEVHLHS